jgi:cytochrome c oxidase subunit 2
MFNGASSFSESVDSAFWFVVLMSTIVFVGIVIAMIYFLVKYRRSKNPYSTSIEGHLGLEITWTAIPLVLFMYMFYLGWVGYKDMATAPKEAIPVKVDAWMWAWQMEYPNGLQVDTLRVPINTPVKVSLHSRDVSHSFYIPAFRFKKDVIPGRTNTAWFKAIKPGAFDIACAEYCGLKHSQMYTKVVVLDSAAFEGWYRAASEKAGKPYTPLVAPVASASVIPVPNN